MFSTKRLRFRQLKLSDVPELMKHWNDPELRQYVDQGLFPMTEEQETEWIKKTHSDMMSGKAYFFGFEYNKKFIGSVGLMNVNNVARYATMGITIYNKAYWGKGLGTEAVRFILEYAFNILNLKTVHLEVWSDNERAYKAYERAGFKKQGRKRNYKFLKGKYVDAILYDITREEWNKKGEKVIMNY